MKVKFIDSESCLIDGKRMIHFSHPLSVFRHIEKTLKEIGPEKFYSSPDQKIKKVRESMPAYFFSLTLKKWTGKDWLIMQPEDQFPDLMFMSIDEEGKISLEQVELVEIMNRCQSLDQMKSEIRKKINKGYPKGRYNLLIFVNHEKSSEWIPKLAQTIPNEHPFISIWTVHLLFKPRDNPYLSVSHRLKPEPVFHLIANLSDGGLYKIQSWPSITEEVKTSEGTILQFKPGVVKGIIKGLRKSK